MDNALAVARQSWLCVAGFTRLDLLLNRVEEGGQAVDETVTHAACLDALDRFKLWAGGIGAFQGGGAGSLARQLRNAPKLRDQVSRLLFDLEEALADVCAIISGEKQNRTSLGTGEAFDEISEGEGDSNSELDSDYILQKSELHERFLFVSDVIAHLFQLNVVIKNTAPPDCYVKAAATAAAAVAREPLDDNRYDIAHIGRKFPKLEKKENEWLGVRMGKTNTLRRQYFQYCRERYVECGPSGRTAASKLEPDDMPRMTTLENVGLDTLVISSSETSGSHIMDILPLSAAMQGRSGSICPYCGVTLDFKEINERKWRNHVLDDMRPYICTFENCGIKMFASRTAWFEHEIEIHRREWRCNVCSSTSNEAEYQSLNELNSHVRAKHAQQIPESILPAFLQACRRLPVRFATNDCPFCEEWGRNEASPDIPSQNITLVTAEQFRDHVGDHMVELASFALPKVSQYGKDAASDTGGRVGGAFWDKHDLFEAVQRSDVETVETLLAQDGMDVNCKDKDGNTPLAIAVGRGEVALSHHFLKCRNARVNIEDDNGRTPVLLAAMNGHKVLLELLLSVGADIGRQDNEGRTLASLAAMNGHTEIINLLLHAESKLFEIADKYGRTPLSLAAERGHHEIVEYLSDQVRLNATDVSGRTALSWACAGKSAGVIDVIETLNRKGADVDIPDRAGRTAVSYAAENPHLVVLKTLMSHGADPSYRDKAGKLPLDYASKSRNHRHALVLFAACSSAQLESTETMTPMEWAKKNQCEDSLQDLVRRNLAEAESWDKIRSAWSPVEPKRKLVSSSFEKKND